MGFRYGIVGFYGPRRRKKPKVVSKVEVVEVREIDLEKAIEAETELREATGGALILGCTFDPLLPREEEIEVIETIEEVSFDGLDEKREAFLICLSARVEELKLKSSTKSKKRRKYKKRKKKS